MSLTPKASIAQVPFGSISIEGLMSDDDGTFGIAIPQICLKLDIPEKNSQRIISTALQNQTLKKDSTTLVKSLPCKDSKTLILKWKTTISRNHVNVILLPDFERLIRKLDKAGNKAAEQIVDDLIGLSMHQLFSDAFGQKFEKEERQSYLIERQSHREDFHPKFTAWLKLDGCDGKQYAIEVNNFKRTLGLPIANVDTYDSKQLRILDVAYIKYDVLRATGMKHDAATTLIR
jgi:hypothetical protein